MRDWAGALSLAWGAADPVATAACSTPCASCDPAAPVERLAELGHYPQLEDPDAIAAAIATALERAG